MATENEPESAPKYHCSCCSYPTSKTSDWTRHLATKKHKNNASTTPGNSEIPAPTPTYICPNCNKSHNDRAGLWRHKKKCIPPQETPQENNPPIPVHFLLDIIKQDRELRNTLIEQNLLFMRRFAEMTQHPSYTARPPLLEDLL